MLTGFVTVPEKLQKWFHPDKAFGFKVQIFDFNDDDDAPPKKAATRRSKTAAKVTATVVENTMTQKPQPKSTHVIDKGKGKAKEIESEGDQEISQYDFDNTTPLITPIAPFFLSSDPEPSLNPEFSPDAPDDHMEIGWDEPEVTIPDKTTARPRQTRASRLARQVATHKPGPHAKRLSRKVHGSSKAHRQPSPEPMFSPDDSGPEAGSSRSRSWASHRSAHSLDDSGVSVACLIAEAPQQPVQEQRLARLIEGMQRDLYTETILEGSDIYALFGTFPLDVRAYLLENI